MFASIMILAHLCIPHHYHGNEVCMERILGMEDQCTHHDSHHNNTEGSDTSEHSQHSQCNHAGSDNHCYGEACVIHNAVIVNNNSNIKKLFEKVGNNHHDSNDNFKEISATEPFKPESYKPLLLITELRTEVRGIFPDLYIPGSNGLRGPPTV